MFSLTLTVQGIVVRLRIPVERVFVPNLVGLFNATQVRVRPGETVADVGTGSGFHAILCAKLGARRVYGVDISPDAVAAARRNARLNGVADKCVFRRGSLLEPLRRLRGGLDLIIASLPNTSQPTLLQEPMMRRFPRVARTLRGGAGLYAEFLHQAGGLLGPAGRIHMHVVDWGGAPRVLKGLRREGFRTRFLAGSHIPRWGHRCNLLAWFANHGGRRSWTVRYDDFPVKRGCKVRVLEAFRRVDQRGERERPAEAVLEWRDVPVRRRGPPAADSPGLSPPSAR